MKSQTSQRSAMIVRLKWKFIGIIMSIVLIFVIGILSTLYLSTQASFERRSLESLRSALWRSEGRGGFTGRVNRSPVTNPLATVRISPNGEAQLIENRLFDYEDSVVIESAKKLYSQNQLEGMLPEQSLRFLGLKNERGETLYVLADVSLEQDALKSQLLHSLGIGFITLVIFFAVSLLLARWMVRPVAQAWEEQRRFVADASHELKTPLTVVLANTDMLLETSQGEDEKNLKRLDHIKAESQRMRGLVESLLTLAKSDSQREKIHTQRINLSQLITYSLLSLEAAVFEMGRTLTDQIEPDIFVQGDEGKLRQLLEILLDNACKYSPHGTAIHVELLTGPKRDCMLSVRSEGEPISPEEQTAIFRRFYRADPSRGKASGYGLGLSIAQTIVKEHKGRIYVRPQDDHSNTFVIQLPKA